MTEALIGHGDIVVMVPLEMPIWHQNLTFLDLLRAQGLDT